jgi:potassium-transporting ATPase ATP-binding subunit
VVLAKEQFNLRGREVAQPHVKFVPFTAQTRMSGVDFSGTRQPARSIRKGAVDAMRIQVDLRGGQFPPSVLQAVEEVSRSGGSPPVVVEDHEVLGLVQLKDVVKGGIRERFAHLRKMGIKTVMTTGDNPLTAAAIAAEAGVDDFMAQATPEAKLKRIRDEQPTTSAHQECERASSDHGKLPDVFSLHQRHVGGGAELNRCPRGDDNHDLRPTERSDG